MQPTAFTEHPEVVKILAELRSEFTSDKREFIVSDVLDLEGHQYVNLVQEGGGVLGIALVGYTYVLEQMNIRFINLAGTSAGAINTILISAIGDKKHEKSTAILEHLSNLNLFDLVDGFWLWRWLIRIMTTNKGFVKVISMIIRTIVALAVLLALSSGVIYFEFPSRPELFAVMMKATLMFIGMVVLLIVVIWVQVRRFHKTGWGLNPGTFFKNWIAKILEKNGIRTVADWEIKIAEKPGDLHIRSPRQENISDLKPEACLIASEISTQVKVEFPKMACLYWKNYKKVNPAEFVRASMSIPIFFETAKISNIPARDPEVVRLWKEMLSYEGEIPDKAMMVDGGLLSNFPINVFFNPSIDIARLPTFGIMLEDEDAKPGQSFSGFGSYLWAIFNTVRYYYDRDFLIKNSIFKKCIGRIDVRKFNWLNFNLSEKEKIQLFIKGAEAAAIFLKGFDWAGYKNYRQQEKARIQVR